MPSEETALLETNMLINPTKNKTKIIATIGPASDSPQVIEDLIRAGMNVARLNFSHGDFFTHANRILRLREAEQATGRRVAIMADLPGPKMRLGEIQPEPVYLEAGAAFTLTTRKIVGNSQIASTSFEPLPQVVKPGDRLFLNDGLVQLIVQDVEDQEVHCLIAVGGELRSRKGLNLPGIRLGVSAFTAHDRECLAFAIANGVDAVSQSFVEKAEDIHEVRSAIRSLGGSQFLIAKIERAEALVHLDEILEAADGLMVARGDLGVELPIERMALIQKEIIAKANNAGKPVITATQMLESMTTSRLPTRAEATDVANAIIDGTDCIMLSAESATGRFPVLSVAMLASIANNAEEYRESLREISSRTKTLSAPTNADEALSEIVERAIQTTPVSALFVRTQSGTTARKISRFKPWVWIVACTMDENICRGLLFSYGVHPIQISAEPEHWTDFTKKWLQSNGFPVGLVLLVAGPSQQNPGANLRIEFLHLERSSNHS